MPAKDGLTLLLYATLFLVGMFALAAMLDNCHRFM